MATEAVGRGHGGMPHAPEGVGEIEPLMGRESRFW